MLILPTGRAIRFGVIAAVGIAAACASNSRPVSYSTEDCARHTLVVRNDTERDVLVYERERTSPNQLLARVPPGRTEIPVEPGATTSFSAYSENGRYLPKALVQLDVTCRQS